MEGIAGVAMAVAPFTGPAAPFVIAGAMALDMISSLLGDPKANRARDLGRQAQKDSYAMPTGTAYNVDTYGRNIDYGANGGPRVVVQMTVNALDSKSIVDRAHDISEAIRHGLNTYPPLRAGIQAAMAA